MVHLYMRDASLLVFMRSFESIWVLVDFYRFLCVFMGPLVSLIIFMRPYGSFVVFMRPHGF